MLRQSSQNPRRRGLGSVWPRIGFVALLCLSSIPGDAHGVVFAAACSWDPLGFGVRGADPGAFPLLPAGPAESAAGRADTAGARRDRGVSKTGVGAGMGQGWDRDWDGISARITHQGIRLRAAPKNSPHAQQRPCCLPAPGCWHRGEQRAPCISAATRILK